MLGTEAGAAYVAVSMRKRLTYTGHTVHGLLDVGHDAGVGDHAAAGLLRSGGLAARGGARGWGADGVSALLVRLDGRGPRDPDRRGVRSAVAVDGVPLDAPVRTAARDPVPTVPPGSWRSRRRSRCSRPARAPGRRRRRADVRDRWRPTDLLGLDARSPIALRHVLLGASDEDALVRAGGSDPEAVPAAGAGRRPTARARPRAQPPARHRGGAADRLLDRRARPGAGCLELARPGQRGAARVHAGLRPGQRAGLRRSGDPEPRRRSTATSRSSARRQRRPGPMRHRPGQQRRAGRQPPVADVQARVAGDVRGVDARARRVAPDPRHGGVRLPLERRRADGRARADRADARAPATTPSSCA